jgi:3-isopropylmalate/(R)-2-methylmalate dehydratase large subunit
MEGRMTVCNMSIEAGARAGMIAPDDTTFAYLEGRRFAPTGPAWEAALDDWRSLVTDAGAVFDEEILIDAATLRPSVSWGTNPAQVVTIDGVVPDPHEFPDAGQRDAAEHALRYMGLTPGTPMRDPGRHRVHRLVHQLAHRGPPGRRRGARRSPGPRRDAGHGGPGIVRGEDTG